MWQCMLTTNKMVDVKELIVAQQYSGRKDANRRKALLYCMLLT